MRVRFEIGLTSVYSLLDWVTLSYIRRHFCRTRRRLRNAYTAFKFVPNLRYISFVICCPKSEDDYPNKYDMARTRKELTASSLKGDIPIAPIAPISHSVAQNRFVPRVTTYQNFVQCSQYHRWIATNLCPSLIKSWATIMGVHNWKASALNSSDFPQRNIRSPLRSKVIHHSDDNLRIQASRTCVRGIRRFTLVYILLLTLFFGSDICWRIGRSWWPSISIRDQRRCYFFCGKRAGNHRTYGYCVYQRV